MPIDELTQITTAYKPLINEIFGNLSDVKAKRSYKDALQDLASFDEQRQKYFKYKDISYKLANTPLTTEEAFTPQLVFDENKLKLTARKEFENTNAWKEYQKYVSDLTQNQNTNSGTQSTDVPATDNPTTEKPMDFTDYIMKSANHIQEFKDLGYLTNRYNAKPEQEILAAKLKKSGITPEDYTFYNEFAKQNFSPDKYNANLVRSMFSREPGMISEGKLGTTLIDMYGNQAKQSLIDKPKVKTHISNGYLITYDDAGNILTKQKIEDTGTKQTNPLEDSNPKDWGVEQVGDEYFYTADIFDPQKGWISQRVRKLTETEINNYKQDLADETARRTSKTSGRKNRGSRGSSFTSPEKAYIQDAIKSLSRLGQVIKSKGGWDNLTSKEDADIKKQYLDVAAYLEQTTNLKGKDLWNVVGKWEKTGKFDDRLFGGLDTADEDNVDNEDFNLTDDAAELKRLHEAGQLSDAEYTDFLNKLQDIQVANEIKAKSKTRTEVNRIPFKPKNL